MKNSFKYLILSLFLYGCSDKDVIIVDVTNDLVSPKTYVVYKTYLPLIIDGKDDEQVWNEAIFTDNFIDIEGVKIPTQKTHIKMLWDTDFLYVMQNYMKNIFGEISLKEMKSFFIITILKFLSVRQMTHIIMEK